MWTLNKTVVAIITASCGVWTASAFAEDSKAQPVPVKTMVKVNEPAKKELGAVTEGGVKYKVILEKETNTLKLYKVNEPKKEVGSYKLTKDGKANVMGNKINVMESTAQFSTVTVKEMMDVDPNMNPVKKTSANSAGMSTAQ